MRLRLWSVLFSLLLVTMVLAVGCQPVPPVETPPVETPPVETPPAETPPAETPPPEVTPVETPAEPGELPVTGEVTITFWAAPNPPQEVFWTEMAQRYMDQFPNVTIQVQAMPEAPTSEAGILTAIAGGQAPTASENIFIGFGGELSRADAIVPLNELEGWEDLLAARSMNDTIQGWEFADGNYYVLPIYSNAMLFGWRIDILEEIGYDAPPRTYSEILEMGQQLREQRPDTFLWARAALTEATWWERWFDFFILYYAASNGQPLITGDEVTADDEAAVEVLTWLQQLAQEDLLLTEEVTDPFETGVSVMSQLGPWTFTAWAERFPDLQLDQTFALTPPPVPDDHPEGEPVNTFADAKGLVVYAQATEDQRAVVWHFIRWVYANPENDLNWMQRTSLPPARDDLATNEVFAGFFDQNPELLAYAEQIPNAVPPLEHPEFTEIQVALGEQALVPVILGQKEPQQAWDDWRNATEGIIQ
jgi:multiple sugar transport system substrate-binding protein